MSSSLFGSKSDYKARKTLFSSKIAGLILSILFLLTSLSLMIDKSADQSINIQQLIEISEDDLTPQQVQALAGARVTSTNWGLHPGGVGSDEGIASSIASNGDLYIAGNICHDTSPCSATFGSSTIYVKDDIFVARLDTNGNWKWVANSNGTSSSQATLTDLEIDASGNAYISGNFGHTKYWGSISKSSHPHTTSSGYTVCHDTTKDGFVAKLDSNGTWEWVQIMQDCFEGFARGIAVDRNQNVYAVGHSRLEYSGHNYRKTVSFYGTSSSQSITTPCSSGSQRDIPWLVKYDSSGVIQWVDRLSDECLDVLMTDVKTDSNSSAIVSGWYVEKNCWGGTCAETLSFHGLSVSSTNGVSDTFVAKVNASHNWEWIIHGGSSSYDESTSLLVDSNDDIYLAGFNDPCSQHTYCESIFGPNINISFGGGFVAKASANGNWIWASRISPIYAGQTRTTVMDLAIHSGNELTIVGNGYIKRLDSTGLEMWNVTNTAEHSSVSTDSSGSAYITGTFTGSLSFENMQISSYGSDDMFIWKWDRDRDGDGVADKIDNCADDINTNQSDHEGDGLGDACDYDDDNDGMIDQLDECPRGNTSWISVQNTDRDSDGCKDDAEDLDDDEDGIQDVFDQCSPNGLQFWNSTNLNDYDSDGCKDDSEDFDDDNDLVNDTNDICNKGHLGWFSNSATDYDGDGCIDSLEDNDDDNDGVLDDIDNCMFGEIGWQSNISVDYDNDGCQDILEDQDDDGDGSLDENDDCSEGVLYWIRNSSVDYDDDGCRDVDEDLDDDNDGVPDNHDLCSLGNLDWVSNSSNDLDSDGCQDSYEDMDDDNDGFNDADDYCPRGDIGWISGRTTDHDSDGCYDAIEDQDDDGDGIDDHMDNCPKGATGWISNGGNDYDGDGCLDSFEDGDDDGDGVNDYDDPCPFGESSCPSSNGSNTTIIHEYLNSSDNGSGPVTTTVIHYHNNSTTVVYYHNNSSNENITSPLGDVGIDNGGIIENKTETDSNSELEGAGNGYSLSDLIDLVTALSLLFIAIFTMMLVIGQKRKKDDELGNSESFIEDDSFMFSEAPEIDDVDDDKFADETEDDSEIEGDNSVSDSSTSPPIDSVGALSTDGNEWIEHPTGSGTHWYRPESGLEWLPWEKE